MGCTSNIDPHSLQDISVYVLSCPDIIKGSPEVVEGGNMFEGESQGHG